MWLLITRLTRLNQRLHAHTCTLAPYGINIYRTTGEVTIGKRIGISENNSCGDLIPSKLSSFFQVWLGTPIAMCKNVLRVPVDVHIGSVHTPLVGGRKVYGMALSPCVVSGITWKVHELDRWVESFLQSRDQKSQKLLSFRFYSGIWNIILLDRMIQFVMHSIWKSIKFPDEYNQF